MTDDVYGQALICAAERVAVADDARADGLVGARIGDLYVKTSAKPARRKVYIVLNTRTGVIAGMRGCELVRLAHEAHRNGLAVEMPREQWLSKPDWEARRAA